MNRARLPFLLILCSFTLLSLAQDLPAFETITRQSADDISLVADFYPAPENISAPPVIIALHMLNSKRAAYEPVIPDLHSAGFAVLNVDMRGHGDSGGSQVWDAAIADISDWISWLDTEEYDRRGRAGDHGREHRRQRRHHQLRRKRCLRRRHRAVARAGLPRRQAGDGVGDRFGGSFRIAGRRAAG